MSLSVSVPSMSNRTPLTIAGGEGCSFLAASCSVDVALLLMIPTTRANGRRTRAAAVAVAAAAVVLLLPLLLLLITSMGEPRATKARVTSLINNTIAKTVLIAARNEAGHIRLTGWCIRLRAQELSTSSFTLRHLHVSTSVGVHNRVLGVAQDILRLCNRVYGVTSSRRDYLLPSRAQRSTDSCTLVRTTTKPCTAGRRATCRKQKRRRMPYKPRFRTTKRRVAPQRHTAVAVHNCSTQHSFQNNPFPPCFQNSALRTSTSITFYSSHSAHILDVYTYACWANASLS